VGGNCEDEARRVKRRRPRRRGVERRAEVERWGTEMDWLPALVAVGMETDTESPPPMRREGSTASMAGAAACVWYRGTDQRVGWKWERGRCELAASREWLTAGRRLAVRWRRQP
jgi:hypothetical protein